MIGDHLLRGLFLTVVAVIVVFVIYDAWTRGRGK